MYNILDVAKGNVATMAFCPVCEVGGQDDTGLRCFFCYINVLLPVIVVQYKFYMFSMRCFVVDSVV